MFVHWDRGSVVVFVKIMWQCLPFLDLDLLFASLVVALVVFWVLLSLYVCFVLIAW